MDVLDSALMPLPLRRAVLPLIVLLGLVTHAARGAVLWSDLGATLVHEAGQGTDILGGAVRRDDTATNVLYFKFHVDPLSDASTEEYFAAFQLFERENERLAIGNSLKAWAYSAFNTSDTRNLNNVVGDVDLQSSRPESTNLSYELPRRGIENTIVFKVQYVAEGDDLITVWLNPDLGPGATEDSQPETSKTTFAANASFDQVRLRHTGGGSGWTFSDMAITTSFADFVGASGIDLAGETTPGRRTAALTFRSWQREQGLPQNSVRALAQTTEGYLWIGSDDGITRFDGVRFVSFGLREGWRNGRVRSLLADNAGGLWIGTAGGGLVRWQGGQFTTLTTAQGLPSDSVTALTQDSENSFWIGTESGLAFVQNGSIKNREANPFAGKIISTLLKDKHGIIWAAVRGEGVFRYVNGKFERLAAAPVEDLLHDAHCLLEDRSGRIWIGAGDDFVLCRETDQWRRYRLPRHLARPYVAALAEEPDGTIWAGSVSEGLFQFRAGKLITVNASTGLSDNFIQSMLMDREGNLWVGTAAGLNRLRRGSLAVVGQNEGLGYGPVYGLAEIASDEIWACKPNDGLYRLHGRFFSRVASPGSNQRYADVTSILGMAGGSCYVATARGLLLFRNSSPAAQAEPEIELANQNVTCLARSREAALLAGTRAGEVWLLKPGGWELKTNLAQTHPVTSILVESDGALWIGTEGSGLHRYKGAERLKFDSHHSLLSDLIRTLYLDSSGDVWVGTAGGGLASYHAGRMTSFTTAEGLPDNTISQILEDGRGRLWLGTDRGLVCLNKAELDSVAAGKTPAVYPEVYGRTEGMSSDECTSGFFPAGLKSRSGQLWFSTTKGLAVVNPASAEAALPPPTVVLEEVLLEGVPIKFRSDTSHDEPEVGNAGVPPAAFSLRLPPGRRSLEFRYTGLNLRAPERVRFRYRLEGLDHDWVDAGTRRSVSFAYVPPGDYTFQVAASDGNGIWNEHYASLTFTVMRHFWQARWFIALAGLGLVGFVAGAVRIVEKRKHQRRLQQLEQERALQRERARIAQDLHDDLGSSLTRLSLLSDLLKADKEIPAQVEVHATKITQSAGQTVRALEEIVWALRPGSDTLQSLVEYISHFANELFDGDRTRCRLNFPHDLPSRRLPPEMRHNIFLIIKEALTNALKHAQAEEVRVQAKVLPEAIEFVVQDDGGGFTLGNRSASNNQHHGLENMQRRAEAMKAKLDITSVAQNGTSVKLVVPFPSEL